jgi:hypothetical protein
MAQPSVATDPAADPRAEDSRPEPGEHQPENVLAVSDSPAISPSVPQRPIRRRIAVTGAGLALFAGVAGLITTIIEYKPGLSGSYYLYHTWYYNFIFAAYLIPIVVAVVALRRIDRLVIVGLLQGMWWPAVALVARDVVASSAYHSYGWTGRFLAGYRVEIASDVLGAAAAILLVVSWSPAVGWSRASRLRPLPVALLCGVGLSQIVVWIALATNDTRAYEQVLGIALLLVGLAVTWYAVNLPAAPLGGALVLGWSTIIALGLLAGVGIWTDMAVLGCALLLAVIFLAVIYMRDQTPSDPIRWHSDT